MTPGQLFFESEFKFADGTQGEKIFLVLNDGACGFYVVIKTTSKGHRYRTDYGCQAGNRFPSFFLPKGSCCLSENTWLCLDDFYELNRNQIIQRHFEGKINRIGALSEEQTLDVVWCAINSLDIQQNQEQILRECAKQISIPLLRLLLANICPIADPKKHPEVIAEIRKKYSHSINVIESASSLDSYTPLMYVFGFNGNDRYESTAKISAIEANGEFVDWIIGNGHLKEISEEDATPGDIVIYYEDDICKHAASIDDAKRVRSKWELGNLYRHALWEVPAHFGTTTRFFSCIQPETATEHFIAFAKQLGARRHPSPK